VSKTDNFRHNVDENVLALGHTRGAYGMNRTFKSAIAALIFAVGFAGSVVAGPLEDGRAAYRSGNYPTAMRLLRPLADKGNAEAQDYLGTIYTFGEDLGVPRDDAAALTWYRKAANQGYAKAQFNLSFLYMLGRGVPEDQAASTSWARKAANQGYPAGQYMLGLSYLYGVGVPQDYLTAYMWFYLADADKLEGIELAEVVKFKDGIAAGITEAATNMTAAQITEAQKRASEWKPKLSP
jgi:TPR repeat protein